MAITGIYTKDFPDLGRDAGNADLIPIAEVGNIITYKIPVSGLINSARVVGALGYTPYGATPGTVGKLAMFGATDLQNSLLSQSGNQINLGTYAAFGVNNPGVPGDPGVDNDAWIGSIINNDFLIKVNNVEALRIDTALRLKIANIPNADYDTDKFLVSDGGVVKYRTGAELLSDIGGASAGDLSSYVTLGTTQTITGQKTLTSLLTGTRGIFASSGSNDTFDINHSSGSGIALNITKAGNGEGLYVNKTSGSGNAATIIGTLNATSLVKSGGTSSQFLKADGSVDSNSYALTSALTGYVPTSRTLTINGTAFDLSANRSWTIPTHDAVTIGTSNGLSLSGQALSMALASGSVTGALSSTDFSTFSAKQNAILLTTTGNSGVATFVGSTLNIPNYTLSGLGGQPQLNGTGFVKVLGTTISYDNSTYALDSNVVKLAGFQTITGEKDFTAVRTNIKGALVIKSGAANGISITSNTLNYLSLGITNGANTYLQDLIFPASSANFYTFPSASGTIALTSNLSAYLPLTGGTLTGALNGTSATFSGIINANAVAGASNGSVNIESSDPTLRFRVTGGTADKRIYEWRAIAAGGSFDYFQLRKWNDAQSSASELLAITNSGNLGLGVTPSAWGSGNALQIGSRASIAAVISDLNLTNNAFYNGTNWIYLNSTSASNYYQSAGTHVWRIAPSGTAGNAISFTQAMTLDASGRLGIGTTSPSYTLDVNGTGRFSGQLIAGSVGSNIRLTADTGVGSDGLISADVNGNFSFKNVSGTRGFVITNTNVFQHSGAATFSSSVTSTGYFVSSDITLKSLTAQTFDASKIDAISYKWKTDLNGKTHVGYSAQDVQKYMPDAVNTDSNGKLSVDYIQVLVQKIAHLEQKLKQHGLE